MLYEGLTGKLPFGEPDTDVRNRFSLGGRPRLVAIGRGERHRASALQRARGAGAQTLSAVRME